MIAILQEIIETEHPPREGDDDDDPLIDLSVPMRRPQPDGSSLLIPDTEETPAPQEPGGSAGAPAGGGTGGDGLKPETSTAGGRVLPKSSDTEAGARDSSNKAGGREGRSEETNLDVSVEVGEGQQLGEGRGQGEGQGEQQSDGQGQQGQAEEEGEGQEGAEGQGGGRLEMSLEESAVFSDDDLAADDPPDQDTALLLP